MLTTPVVRALYENGDNEVHFLTKPAFAPILEANPNISKVFVLKDNFRGMIRELRNEHYDLVADLHHNIRTKRIKLALGRSSRSFHKLNFEKWLMVRFGLNKLPNKHIVDRYMETVQVTGVSKDDKGLDFFIPPNKSVDIRAAFGFDEGKYVSFVIGAAHQTKCLTAPQIITICVQLNSPVILMGSKAEMAKAELIEQAFSNGLVKNSCSGYDIMQSASILQQAGAVITHDTGLMHIAAALQKLQIVVWGNTIPQFGMYPYYGSEKGRWISFERPELKCRPCSKIGFETCPKGHFKCIMDQDLDAIAQSAISILSQVV